MLCYFNEALQTPILVMRVFSEPELVASLIRKDFDGKVEQAVLRPRGVLCRIITVVIEQGVPVAVQ
jgi:hypothetical protein